MAGDKRAEVFLDAGSASQPLVAPGRPDPDLPFRILVLADLRGDAADRPALAERTPIRVDRDDLPAVLERLEPRVDVRLDGTEAARVTLRFRDLDDFHPDRLYESLPAFAALRELRERLENPRTFAQAARELTGEPLAPAPRPGAGSVLDAILGEAGGGAVSAPAPPPPRDALQQLLRSIVAPHLVPGEDPRQPALLERVDGAATALMRAVLHDPRFRAVEAAWRAIDLVVRRLETDASLGIWLLDITRDELLADLGGEAAVGETALHRTVVEREAGTPGGVPWSLIAGDFTFGPDAADVRVLARLAAMGRATGAPFLAAAAPGLAGSGGFASGADPADFAPVDAPEWRAFRRSPDAHFAGLALPRFLLRPPWGAAGEPAEAFEFEEVDAPPRHEDLLWGNPAFACVIVLARAFARAGWAMRSALEGDLTGLPLHLYRVAGETRAQPCAEVLLTERSAARLLELGLMPLASIRDRDAVRLVRLQSVADPLAAPAGRW